MIREPEQTTRSSVNFAGNIERNDSEYAGKFQEEISRSLSLIRENLSELGRITQDSRASDDDADMFDVVFADAENGASFPFTEEGIREKYMEYGDTIRVYPECLHILRAQLGTKMQEDMDDILNAVMLNMKDKFGYIVPAILYGLELLNGWKLNYRSFAQHRIREALNCLDPLDEANRSQGVPRNESEVLDMLQDFYEQAIYEMRKRFDGHNGIYPEPNNAAFAAAEEFKDIMIRSGSDEDKLKIEWKRLYRPIRGDV